LRRKQKRRKRKVKKDAISKVSTAYSLTLNDTDHNTLLPNIQNTIYSMNSEHMQIYGFMIDPS